MKACILAGGEGRRLRPLTCSLPKPLVSVCGKSVLLHIVDRLKACGISELALTLAYMPEAIKSHLSDGRKFGVSVDYFVEKTPLGTAGGVKAAADVLKDDDFIVIAGDCMCALPLEKAIAFHKEKNADVTIVLTHTENLLEYGLALTSPDGKITGFVEKPPVSRVFSDLVNTGIYIVSPRVLDLIPQNTFFDFARDLFPLMLKNKRALYGVTLDGYWCDIGDIGAYLRCSLDVLSGLCPASLDLPCSREGVYAPHGFKLPDGVKLTPPVYIGHGVRLEQGCEIGPQVILGSGAYVGEGARVRGSVVLGSMGRYSEVTDAIVCAGASVGKGSVMLPLSVAGSGGRIGEHCTVLAGVRIYPDIKIPHESVLRRTVLSPPPSGGLFENGEVKAGLNCETSAALGSALAGMSGKARRILIGHDTSERARALADAFSSGLRAAGCDAFESDVGFEAGAAGVANLLDCPYAAFFRGEPPVLRIYDSVGLPISAEAQKKLNSAVGRGEYTAAGEIGQKRVVTGSTAFYARARAQRGEGGGLSLSVYGQHPAAAALKEALKLAGFELSGTASGLSISEDGFSFTLSEGETRIGGGDCRALALLAACVGGKAKSVALPYSDPDAYDLMAAKRGCRVLRLERDGKKAAQIYAVQEFLHDAAGGIICLFSLIASGKHTLEGLKKLLPRYALSEVEVEVGCERGRIMRELAKACGGMSVELVDGLKVFTDGGYVRALPCEQKSALKILAESFSSEIAAELAADFADRTRRIDLSDRKRGK